MSKRLSTIPDNKGAVSFLVCVSIAIIGISFQIPMLKVVGIAGAIGAGTNRIAIRMLFREMRILGFKVPFSGVIPSNRKDITEAIVDTVEKEILPSEAFVKHAIQDPTIQRKLRRTVRRKFGQASDQAKQAMIDYVDTRKFFSWVKRKISRKSFWLEVADTVGFANKDDLVNLIIDEIKKAISGKMGNDLEGAVIDTIASQDIIDEKTVHDILGSLPIRDIIISQLDSFSDNDICELVERTAHQHLGWLEVWGAVLGAICGVIILFV